MAAPPPEERALLESIRSGKASSNVKRQASRGVFPVSADEQLEILVFLTQDADPTCSQAARETLASWTAEKCLPLLARPDCAADVLAYFASQPEVPEAMRDVIAAHSHADDAALAPLAWQLSLEQVHAILGDEERLEGLTNFIAATVKRSDLPANQRARLEELQQKHAVAQQELEAALAREEEAEALAAERERPSASA
jgi:hypothetical protein